MFEDLHKKNGAFERPELERKILSHTSQLKVPATKSKEEAFEMLKLKMIYSEGRIIQFSPKRRKAFWFSSAAAILLFLFGTWYVFIRTGTTNIVSPKGEHMEYQLPDKSIVTLNADSKISFNKKNFLKNRFLKLNGEAFFKVQKGSSFTIRTQFADIKVLGTSFNIYARENSFKVSCVTGKVQVKNENNLVVLTAGESARSTNKHLTEFRDINIEASTNWRVGEFYFENAPLNVVFKEIERQFNVTFTLPEMENKFYTGGFSNKNLVDALDVVCIPMELNYEIGSNSKIRVRYNSE